MLLREVDTGCCGLLVSFDSLEFPPDVESPVGVAFLTGGVVISLSVPLASGVVSFLCIHVYVYDDTSIQQSQCMSLQQNTVY